MELARADGLVARGEHVHDLHPCGVGQRLEEGRRRLRLVVRKPRGGKRLAAGSRRGTHIDIYRNERYRYVKSALPPAPARMGTYVRGGSSHHPSRRPGRVLRLGRAAGRPAAARAAGDRRRGRRAGGQLRGESPGRPHGDGRPPGAAALPRRRRRAASHGGLRRGEQGRVSRVRGHDAARRGALDRRGVPRHARDGAPGGKPGGDRGEAPPRGQGAGRPADHGRGRADEVPRQGGERRREARRAAGRPARPRARLPAPAPGRAALGRRAGRRPAGCTASGSRPSRRWPGSRRPRSRRSSAAPPAGTCTRSPTTAIPARWSGAGVGARSARSGRAGRDRRRRSTPCSWGSSTGSRDGCGRLDASAGRSSSACASTTSRARPDP